MVWFQGWALPDAEEHLQGWMLKAQQRRAGRLCYQKNKYDAALQYCQERRTALDVGAHVGLFSYWMAEDFRELHAFEPHPTHRECWNANMRGRCDRAHLYPVALGSHLDAVALETPPAPRSTGDTFVRPDRGPEPINGCGLVPMMRLDDYPLVDVDFLKIDVEGGELGVVQGGLETIRRWHPVILVEQKAGHGAKYGLSDTAARDLLLAEGYTLRQTLSGDDILTWGGV